MKDDRINGLTVAEMRVEATLAPRGEWVRGHGITIDTGEHYHFVEVASEDVDGEHVAKCPNYETSRHIATFDSPTVLALLDALEDALGEARRLREQIEIQKVEARRLNGVVQRQSKRLKESEHEPGALPSAVRYHLIARAETAEQDRDRLKAEVERLTAIIQQACNDTGAREHLDIEQCGHTILHHHASLLTRSTDVEARVKELEGPVDEYQGYLAGISEIMVRSGHLPCDFDEFSWEDIPSLLAEMLPPTRNEASDE